MELDRIPWSFHTHSQYCDGEGPLEGMVLAALDASVSELGFSSHAPLPFATDWNMPLARLPAYMTEVRELQTTYADRINLYLGAELDYIPQPAVKEFQESEIIPAGFDYFVGSVHFLGSGDPPASFDGTEEEFRRILREDYGDDIRAMTGDYYGRVAKLRTMPDVRIVGHFDLIKRWNVRCGYFHGDEPWYLDQVEAALCEIAGTRLAVELNTAGWRKELREPYPSSRILERCRDLDIPITVSSDAHTPRHVDWGYGRALALLRTLHIQPVNAAALITR